MHARRVAAATAAVLIGLAAGAGGAVAQGAPEGAETPTIAPPPPSAEDLGTAPSGQALTPLIIETADGEAHQFRVEVVDTPRDRSFGLMFRMSLSEDYGMLFVFSAPQPLSFWMRNTFVSLDIIFIDEFGRIVNVAENTTILSEASVPSDGPALYVLETLAGTAERLGLEAGDIIRHERIGTRAPV